MNSDNQNDSLISLKKLSANDDYYNIVFKKTERIASAVFYILSHVELNERTRVHFQNLSDKSMSLHEAAIASLNLYEYEVRDKLYPLQQSMVVLQSAMRLAAASGLFTVDMETVIAQEIDVVLRYIRNHYTSEASARPSIAPESAKPNRAVARPRRTRPNIPSNDFSSDAVFVYSDLSDRTSRIKTVLEAKPEATIKDLSEIITDVSTKTIQRDLNSLIESGEVIRQGERRWSKYSIAK